MASRLLGTPLETPPVEDIPEEILRTEIIFEARSSLDGSPITVADYAELQNQLQAPLSAPTLSAELRYVIFLLKLRRAGRSLLPILP